jgi:tRNA U38,U39,U40 pseudouridine synthase TruA
VTRVRWSIDQGPEATDADGPAQSAAGSNDEARLLRFEISANSFCHQMVRSLVGSLVEVGRGRQNAAGLLERLRAVSRHAMPDPAPAEGLCLVSVDYGVKASPPA